MGTRSSSGGTWTSTQTFTGVTVTRCLVAFCPGDASSPSPYQSSSGILFSNCANSIIERSYVSNCGANETQGNAGIEFNQCHGSTMQFCEVYRQISINAPADGDGLDLDFGCQDCIIQYCYAHECDGAGSLLYNFGGYLWSNNTVRYCLFENNNQAGHLFGFYS